MPVLYVIKWDILPDKIESYTQWTQSAIQRILAVPGVIEFRAYRSATGSSQAVVTYEFADMATWAAWYSNEEVQKVLNELRTFATNISMELLGPSPIVPEPVRPGK
jgi:antibiotic biosynthesis monooxygenase (ABM) superfamily enzyme